MVPAAWRLKAPLAPAFRRGLWTAIPVAGAFLIDLEGNLGAASAVSLGALCAGFIAFDAPGRTRFAWQIACAPLIGVSGALGVLTHDPGWLATVGMWVIASTAAISIAVSMRLYVAALNCVLAFLLAQGLAPSAHVAVDALLLGALGVAIQALFALATAPLQPPVEHEPRLERLRQEQRQLREGLRRGSVGLHHALRWGSALAVGVAAYHIVDLGPHGYWIPLTILFVLRPAEDETVERIAMRAAGTVAGLLIGTPLAMLVGGHPIPEAIVICVAAGFTFALLAIEYALFTTAITAMVVLMTHAFGQSASSAAGERAIATAAGIAIVAAIVALWVVPLPRRD